MAELGRYTGVLILLFLTLYCYAKPLQSEENISELNTTPCPEELAQELQPPKQPLNIAEEQNHPLNPETEHSNDDTTPCPEELAKRKYSGEYPKDASEDSEISSNANEPESLKNNVDNDTQKQPPIMLEVELQSALEKTERNTEKNAETQEENTICPEELKKLEATANELQKSQESFHETSHNNFIKDGENKLNTEHINIIRDPTKLASATLKNQPSIDRSQPLINAQQQSEDRFGNEQTSRPDNPSGSEKSDDATTKCPEELLKEQTIQHKLDATNTDTKSEVGASSTAEQLPVEEGHFESQALALTNANEGNSKQALSENEDAATTTLCPEEEAKRNAGISAKTLLNIQKDSALLKLVKDKLGSSVEAKDQENQLTRNKRQTANYSPYYSNQPTYNSQGVAVTPDDPPQQQKSNKNYHSTGTASHQNNEQSSYKPKPSNTQRVPVSYNNIKTYQQQLQRQYQGLYPHQPYQNYVKPVKGGYHSNLYSRYPTSGNFKNYYKPKSAANRRQFQANARPRSTTARSIRATIKKKFRPSPVFA